MRLIILHNPFECGEELDFLEVPALMAEWEGFEPLRRKPRPNRNHKPIFPNVFRKRSISRLS
jgi:hypothetical protein